MKSNVHQFPKRAALDAQFKGIQPEVYQAPPPLATLTRLRPLDTVFPFNPTLQPLDSLETSLDEYRSTQLELAHKRKAFELQMHLEESTAQLRLEALAYKALVTGVPESDIYALGEDMAEALESAMNTVAGA